MDETSSLSTVVSSSNQRVCRIAATEIFDLTARRATPDSLHVLEVKKKLPRYSPEAVYEAAPEANFPGLTSHAYIGGAELYRLSRTWGVSYRMQCTDMCVLQQIVCV